MSGLFGTVEFSGISRDELEARTSAAIQCLAHRGTQPAKVWVSDCGKVALAQCDDSDSNLFQSSSQQSIMALDGEIYNLQELREQFANFKKAATAAQFFLDFIESEGSLALPKFEGMFAGAIFNQSKRQVILSVDHAGQKPLFIYQDKKRIIFASEIKAIKAFGGIDLSLSSSALKEYLIYGFVPNPRTLFENVTRMQPGHFQVIDILEGPRECKKYWDLPILGPELEGSSADFHEEFRRLLRKSVKKRLAGHAPLGVLLSGGIDSGAIAFEASQLGVQEKLKTFSMGFLKTSRPEFRDESQYSRLVAAKIKSDHSETQVDAITGNLDQLLRQFDEPMSAPNAIPTSLLFQEAKRHMKVALAGYGADQLLGGNSNLQVSLTVDQNLGRLRFLLDHWPFKRLPEKVKAAIGFPLINRLMTLESLFSEQDLKGFFGEKFELKLDEAERLRELTYGIERSRCALYINFKNYLFDGILPVVDRTSAMNGLSVRNPFLDKELIEFTVLLPPQIRMNGRTTKSLIRDSYREILGTEIADRSKTEDKFPLSDFLAPKLKGEDFRKLESYGVHLANFKFSLKTAQEQAQFLTLYALEGFLKQLEITSGIADDKVSFRSNLQSLFNEDKDGSLEWLSP
jgi:asparagine synthase (glutamine-hydrolysing)